MIPCDCDDIKKEYNILLSELERYNPELLDKDRVLAITKCDMLDEQMKNEMKNLLPDNIESVFISSVTGENIQQLKDILWRVLNK
jgi:GTP-binding protein